MNIKKIIFAVLGLLPLAYFSTLSLVIVANLNTGKSVSEDEVLLVERNDMKLWQGKVLDKPAHLIGDYILFPVEYVNGKQEKSRISVIFKPNFKWSQTNSRDFSIGDEVLFFQPVITAQVNGKALFCPVGVYYPYVYKGEAVVNRHKIANLSNKGGS